MREIKLKSVPYLRSVILKVEVDENTVEFKDGVALVEATITREEAFSSKTTTYQCYGLIDENFQEVFDDSIAENFAERQLMFLAFNSKAIRIGSNDFIVHVSCTNRDIDWIEYRHIRLVDGIPTLIHKNIESYQITSNENILITGLKGSQSLYDISKGEFVTPPLSSIEVLKEKETSFDVTAIVDTIEEGRGLFADYLFFQINSRGAIISPVVSSIAGGTISCVEFRTIHHLLEDRKKVLLARESQIEQEVSKLKVLDVLRKTFHTKAKN